MNLVILYNSLFFVCYIVYESIICSCILFQIGRELVQKLLFKKVNPVLLFEDEFFLR